MTASDGVTGRVAVLGSINMDVVLRVARFPASGETLIASGLARHLGGKGANQAVAAARAGAQVALTGAVGDDAEGRSLRRALAEAGVDCTGVRVDRARPTGFAQILVDDAGDNQIVVLSGANEGVAAGRKEQASVYLAQLETPAAATLAWFAARPASSLAILNAAPADLDAWPALCAADLVVLNETELSAFAGSVDTVAAAASALRARIGGALVVTLGAAGSLLVRAEGVHRFAAASVAKVVDTTGAGDCFCGYLAASLAGGLSIEAGIARAHRAAAIAVSRPGAADAIPYASELG